MVVKRRIVRGFSAGCCIVSVRIPRRQDVAV